MIRERGVHGGVGENRIDVVVGENRFVLDIGGRFVADFEPEIEIGIGIKFWGKREAGDGIGEIGAAELGDFEMGIGGEKGSGVEASGHGRGAREFLEVRNCREIEGMGLHEGHVEARERSI